MLSLGHHRHLTRKPADLPEYPFSLQTVWLLEEVDAGHHDGGDGALLVVDDPLQRHAKLLAGHPAGHGEVGGGDSLGQSALFLVIVSHWCGYWQSVDIHVVLQFRQMIHVLDLTAKLCTETRNYKTSGLDFRFSSDFLT